MSDFFIHTKLKKALPNSSESLKQQLNILHSFIKDISSINPLLETWYVNNATSEKPPLDLPFPSERASKYLIQTRKSDKFETFNLWNGSLDDDYYVGVDLSFSGIRLNLVKGFNTEQVEQLFITLLKYLNVKYICISNNFFNDNSVFEHRLPVSSICYVPQILENNALPFLYKVIHITNDLNSGTILVFDEDIFDESDAMKKKLQENAIALVDLDLLPAIDADAEYFSNLS